MAEVMTTAGCVRGRLGSHGSHVFLGVPFASTPIGERRFRGPVPVEPWDGVRDAIAYGATAPQPPHGFTLIPEPVIGGVEFLNLNITTPEIGDARLPVLVWIHGGGFTSGGNASPWYLGEQFSRDGVVVVSVNYRLGVEGFLVLDGADANRGALDWIAALEWVQHNIGGFGGDPSRVTVAGQSAGGAACATLLASERADGLFHQAIMMSGAAHMTVTADAAEKVAQRIATHFGISRTREAFVEIPVDRVIEAQQATSGLASMSSIDPAAVAARLRRGILEFGPTPDGSILSGPPIAEIAAGHGARVPVLAGCTSEELNIMGSLISGVTEEQFEASLVGIGLSSEQSAHYRETRGDRPFGWVLGQVLTDHSFRMPAVRLAEARAAGPAPTYLYEFRWPSPAMGGLLGAAHCLDLPFAFDCLDAEGVTDVLGEGPPSVLARAVHSALVGFVSRGDPGWPNYQPPLRATMVFDMDSQVVDDPIASTRAAWEGID